MKIQLITVIFLMIYSEIENKSKTVAKIISEIMQVILRSVKKVCSVCNQVIVTRILMMVVWYQINLCKMQTGEMNLIVHSNEIYKMIIVVDVVYTKNTQLHCMVWSSIHNLLTL